MTDYADKLKQENEALRKINRVLMERVERVVDDSAGAYAVFEHNIRLQKLVAERTEELNESNRCLVALLNDQKQISDALQESQQRAAKQRSAIAQLLVDPSIVGNQREPAFRRAAEVAAATIGVARASIWLLSDDGEEMQCRTLYEAEHDRHSSGAILKSAQCTRYFAAIMAGNRIDAEDAQTDPRTNELTESYLKPMGITSILDAGILREGRLTGVICLEHTGPKRRWHVDEESFVSAVAAIVAQLLVNTERIRAEEEVLKLTRAVEQSAAAIVITDLEGLIQYANPAFARTSGYSVEEALGRNPRILKSGEVPQKEYKKLWATITAGGEWHGEFHNKRKDGTLYWESAHISPIRDAAGNSTHYLAIKQDITDRKRAEEDLQQANCDLEAAIGRANFMATKAEAASVSKSEFLANMSHEIRTPLNGVIGLTGLLLQDDLKDRQRRYAEIIQSSGEALLVLLNDILDFSKIEAGKLELEAADFDVQQVLDNCAYTLAARAFEKNLELVHGADPDVPTLLRGDAARLRQILTNLAGNAIKFTEKGEVVIRVSKDSDQGAKDVSRRVGLRFSVRDTGVGIPKDKQELLFAKFSQVDGSATRRFGGTGLGLAISRELVEMMGGEIGVESDEGTGSEFWFTVTLELQANQAKEPLPEECAGVRALIIDDNASVREILSAQMSAWGMRVDEIPDGMQALSMLMDAANQKDPYRVVVLDLHMPGVDGQTLGDAIRDLELPDETRLILLAPMGALGDSEQPRAYNVSACLNKPVRMRDFRDTLVQTPAGAYEPRAVARDGRPVHAKRFADRSARVLLVEDHEANRVVALGLLEMLGLRADVAVDGADAIKAARETAYDIVFMDVQMPVMDGYEATRRIREMGAPPPDTRHPTPVIIAMTAHAMSDARGQCLAAGMDDYLSKPLDADALISVLEKWLPKDTIPETAEADRNARKETETPGAEPDSVGLPIYDKQGMFERLMQKEDLVRRVSVHTASQLPEQLRDLSAALEGDDADTVELTAHTIKGAAANVGGEVLRALAGDMERAASDGDLGRVRAGMSALRKEIGRLLEAIEREWGTEKEEGA